MMSNPNYELPDSYIYHQICLNLNQLIHTGVRNETRWAKEENKAGERQQWGKKSNNLTRLRLAQAEIKNREEDL